MTTDEATALVSTVMNGSDDLIVATDRWRSRAIEPLDPDSTKRVAVVVKLNSALDQKSDFASIIKIDEKGIWFTSAATNLRRTQGAAHLIPWNQVRGVTLHDKTRN